MDVYGVQIPNKPLTNFELLDYVQQLKIVYIPHNLKFKFSLFYLGCMHVFVLLTSQVFIS